MKVLMTTARTSLPILHRQIYTMGCVWLFRGDLGSVTTLSQAGSCGRRLGHEDGCEDGIWKTSLTVQRLVEAEI